MGLKKRLTSAALAAAMVLTMAVPMTASADTTWTAPTEPMTVDNNVAKVAAHAAASTSVSFLGGNMVVERASDYKSITSAGDASAQYEAAKAFVKLGVLGTSINESPDPYLWNYLYNKGVDAGANTGEKVDDEVYLSSVGSPVAVDTTVIDSLGTSYTLARRPDVLMDTKGGYDALISQLPENTDDDTTNDYNPISLSYEMKDLTSFTNDMYNLAEAMTASGKTGRYGDPEKIAQQYESYIKGVQLYVLSEIAKGNVEKKTVAIIDATGKDTDEDGVVDMFKLFDSNTASGTAASCRGAEYCENITDNIIDKENIQKNEDGSYWATAEQVCKADAIMTGVQAQINNTESEVKTVLVNASSTDNVKESADVPPVQAVDPADVFSIRANSVENIMGVPLYAGFIYPEVFNPIYGAMYIYDNFWHVKDSSLISLANSNFAHASLPEGIERSGAGYSGAAVQAKVDQGLTYYNSHKSDFEGTKLEISDKVDLSGYTEPEPPAVEKISISKAKISTISNRAYTGKAIKPTLTVKYNGKTLKKGTDYTVTYKNNIKTGKATATVKGTGKYTGTKSATFKIVPKKATVSKAYNVKTRSLKVYWKKDTHASGYKVAIATNSSMTKNVKTKYFKSYKTTNTKFTKLKKGKTYYVRLTAYKTIDGKKYYGTKSSYKKVKIRK